VIIWAAPESEPPPPQALNSSKHTPVHQASQMFLITPMCMVVTPIKMIEIEIDPDRLSAVS
jgi:hypothetical protein